METYPDILEFSPIPCLYHPMKIVFLDDNSDFLKTISYNFSAFDNLLMFINPEEAFNYISSNYKDYLNIILDPVSTEDSINQIGGIHINKIIDPIYDSTRYNIPGIIVVDFSMPTINGVEFCKQLKGKELFKILLTAEADQSTAIDAFNKGIIDQFILKTDSNFLEKLKKSISEFTLKYFNNVSKLIVKGCGPALNKLLNNDDYNRIFKNIFFKTNSIEYYLLDNIGSFLFLTATGNPTWLIVCDQLKLNEYIEFLEGYSFSELLIEKIKMRKSLLFLFSEKEHKEEISLWDKYIFDSHALNEEYVYSIVQGKITASINWNKVISYKAVV
ncbi:response regulator [Legionella clemsonensis]|uniref:Response regulator FixJ n=1 Tax=Legionella clemsonensis TaxID=1867846 RepID=A0A222NYS9_9GAMM|nr:response regulator [Legionella clemsonensis]ASQ44715.1 response regulator FixJ [Legionella clemsonensis]